MILRHQKINFIIIIIIFFLYYCIPFINILIKSPIYATIRKCYYYYYILIIHHRINYQTRSQKALEGEGKRCCQERYTTSYHQGKKKYNIYYYKKKKKLLSKIILIRPYLTRLSIYLLGWGPHHSVDLPLLFGCSQVSYVSSVHGTSIKRLCDLCLLSKNI